MAVICVIFSVLPFATATEIQNTDVNQSVTVNASNNTIKYGELKTKGLEMGSKEIMLLNYKNGLKIMDIIVEI